MATYCQFPKSTLKHSFLYSILRIRTLITRKKKSLKETRLKRNYLTPLHRDSDRRHRWSSIAAERHEHAPATVDPQSVDDEAKHHSTLLAERSYSFTEKKENKSRKSKKKKKKKRKKEKNPENPNRKKRKNPENPKRKKIQKIKKENKEKKKKRKKSRKSK